MCSCWDELTQTSEKRNGYNAMIGKYATNVALMGNANSSRIYYIPLMFWFCNSIEPKSIMPVACRALQQEKHFVPLLNQYKELV
jgi:hypothetical protein